MNNCKKIKKLHSVLTEGQALRCIYFVIYSYIATIAIMLNRYISKYLSIIAL